MDTSFKTRLIQLFFISALALSATPGWSAPESAAQTPKVVNVNTADAATLAAVLDGIGEAKAQAIIAYRKEHGPFKSADELAEVKGIGDKWVAANRDRIVLK